MNSLPPRAVSSATKAVAGPNSGVVLKPIRRWVWPSARARAAVAYRSAPAGVAVE